MSVTSGANELVEFVDTAGLAGAGAQIKGLSRSRDRPFDDSGPSDGGCVADPGLTIAVLRCGPAGCRRGPATYGPGGSTTRPAVDRRIGLRCTVTRTPSRRPRVRSRPMRDALRHYAG